MKHPTIKKPWIIFYSIIYLCKSNMLHTLYILLIWHTSNWSIKSEGKIFLVLYKTEEQPNFRDNFTALQQEWPYYSLVHSLCTRVIFFFLLYYLYFIFFNKDFYLLKKKWPYYTQYYNYNYIINKIVLHTSKIEVKFASISC